MKIKIKKISVYNPEEDFHLIIIGEDGTSFILCLGDEIDITLYPNGSKSNFQKPMDEDFDINNEDFPLEAR